MRTADQLLLIAGLAITATGCAPVFSELQSARTVGKNRVEITPSYSSINYSEEGWGDGFQKHVGAQVAYGITPRLDMRLRYEFIWLKDAADENVSVIGFGPKFALWQDWLAVTVPVGKIISDIGADVNGNPPNTWQVHPTLLFSAPVIKDMVHINLSPKLLIPLCDDCQSLVAANFGLALSTNLNKWALRPEYGVLFGPELEGYYSHFSIGISAAFGK